MRAHGRPVEEVERPIDLALLLERCQAALPDAGPLPAIAAAGDRLPRAKAFGQIAPGRSRFRNPQDTIKDRSMILVGPARSWAFRREHGRHLRPLLICQFMSSHVPILPPLCTHALAIVYLQSHR